MNKNNLSVLVVIAGVVVSSTIMGSALAQTLQPQEQKMPGDIQYPIPELGNCTSKADCKVFCDDSKNNDACLKFAEEKNLLSPEELTMTKKFKDAGMVGPGGCKGQSECDAYCGNKDHMEECMTFAIKNGMMDPEKQKESEKVLAAIKKGIKMPACNGQKECDAYCSSPEHMEECMNFSIEAGIMDEQKQGEAKKVLAAIKKGIKMPACNGQKECDAYCSSPEHMEECMTFSIEAGMMPEQDKEKAQKMLTAIKQGIKPPACKGKEECDAYCQSEEHMKECIDFSVAMGNMTEEQAKMAIKTGGKGPGGCKDKEECDAFCNNPDNQETCFQFGKENGMIPEEDLKKMEEGQQKMKESFSQMPQEVLDCLSSSVGADVIEKMKTGSMVPQKAGDAINKCFQQYKPQGKAPNEQGQGGQEGSNNGMPGDLKDCLQAQVGEDGLAKLQSKNVEDPALIEKAKPCFEKYGQQNQQGQSGDKFQPGPGVVNPGGQQMPQQAGPGGCKGPEECKAYCESHQEECKNFQPQPGQSGQPDNQIAPGTDSSGGGIMQFMKNVKDKFFVPNNQQGQPGNVGGPNEGQGFNSGSGQGGGGQSQGTNPNPVKCIEDCELTGRNCVNALGAETDTCIRKGQNCRQITCETVDADGNRSTAEVMRECYASKCDPLEASCHAAVTAKDSACRTAKDVCVMNCQKTSKSEFKSQSGQSGGVGGSNQGGGQGLGGAQFAPGTQQMNQLSPEIEKEMRVKMEEAIKNGQIQAGFEGGNFELKDIKSFQDIQNQMPIQGGQVPAPEGQQPGQYIQGQPGQQMQQQNQQGQFIQMQPGQLGQPGQMQPPQQPSATQQPPAQQQPNQPMPQGQFIPPSNQAAPPSGEVAPSPQPLQTQPTPPSSFMQNAQKILGSVWDAFR